MAGVFLPAGYQMTLTASAVTAGNYTLVGSPDTYTVVAAGVTVTVGPFAAGRQYDVNNLSTSQAVALYFADDDNVNIDGGTIDDVTITNATLANIPTTQVEVGSIEEVAGLSMVVKGNGLFNQVQLTLDAVSVPITSTSTANGFGGVALYNYPTSHMYTLGAVCELSIAVPEADEGDYTDATPEGDIGVGTVIIANADAMGTDATDDNIATANAFTMADYVDALVPLEPEGVGYVDNVAGTRTANLNVLVDAADIDNDATTTVEISGTIYINFLSLGTHEHEA